MNEIVPLVSIICPTYNHEKFIARSIEGFLIQKTNFPFEIIVHDDASTDGTKDIIRDFENKFPHLFSNIYQEENQYSKGRGNGIIKILLTASRGKYIAVCEGDDCWTDPNKLQKQIDFLEANPEYVLCAANARVENLTDKPFREVYCDFAEDRSFDQKEILTTFYCPTLSMVFRNEVNDVPDWFYDVKSGDTFLHLLLSRYGKFYYFNFMAGVYCQHDGGISNIINKAIWFENNIIHLRKVEPYMTSESKPFLNEVIYKNQLELIGALKEGKQYKRALAYFNQLEQIPFSIRRKYMKRVMKLFFRTLTKR